MIAVNLRDGTTRKFDLTDPAQLDDFNRLGRQGRQATGIWILGEQRATLPMPTCFRRVFFHGEAIGTTVRVVIQADDVRITATRYPGHDPVKVEIRRAGRQVHAPEAT